MEHENDVQLLHFHLDLDRAFGAMGLFLYLHIILLCGYFSMHLLFGFLFGAMTVHN
jgi:hypothetical protein